MSSATKKDLNFDLNELYKNSHSCSSNTIKIPGIDNLNDSDSSSDSLPEHNNFLRNKKPIQLRESQQFSQIEEYVPTCSSRQSILNDLLGDDDIGAIIAPNIVPYIPKSISDKNNCDPKSPQSPTYNAFAYKELTFEPKSPPPLSQHKLPVYSLEKSPSSSAAIVTNDVQTTAASSYTSSNIQNQKVNNIMTTKLSGKIKSSKQKSLGQNENSKTLDSSSNSNKSKDNNNCSNDDSGNSVSSQKRKINKISNSKCDVGDNITNIKSKNNNNNNLNTNTTSIAASTVNSNSNSRSNSTSKSKVKRQKLSSSTETAKNKLSNKTTTTTTTTKPKLQQQNNSNLSSNVVINRLNVEKQSFVATSPLPHKHIITTDMAIETSDTTLNIRKRSRDDNEQNNTTKYESTMMSSIEFKDEIIWLTNIPKKNMFDVNLQLDSKYYKNILPIFNKGIRLELFVQRDKNDLIWSNVSIKNIECIRLPIAIYKIVNVDENIINNLNTNMNNSVKFKESILNTSSDKNYKIYDESGIIRLGKLDYGQTGVGDNVAAADIKNDKSLYANARIELKKNITYVFNLSLNVIFAKNYINVQSEHFKCSLHCRTDNNYLLCLVVVVACNYTIENGMKLMHNI